ncbi:MAG: WYL domain-containing protein [Microbacterium sp.]
MGDRIPAEERVMQLVVALMATQAGLTRGQIEQSVIGYRERSGVSKDALERMFERDKDELRRLGIPLETIPSSTDPTDLREARYRIPKSEYGVPDDVEFTPAELALLALAGEVWSASSLSSDARAGLRKIRALGIDVDEPILGFAPRVAPSEAAFAPLQEASDLGRVVSFDYVRPGGSSVRRRHVAPLALVQYEGRWHVYGEDQDLDDVRTFLLSRIVSPVSITQKTFDLALKEGAGDRAAAGLDELARSQKALIEVTPGTEGALQLRRRGEPATKGWHVSYVDPHIFADELASYGPEVRVVAPESLRDLVIERLRASLAMHGGGA